MTLSRAQLLIAEGDKKINRPPAASCMGRFDSAQILIFALREKIPCAQKKTAVMMSPACK